jgi:hypothetical protein
MKLLTKPSKTCYVCGGEPSSQEHVPARGFFLDDASYRKQLITVPSCDRHNQDTSADDEYTRNIITAHHANNSLAFKQFKEKVVKSLKLNITNFGKPRKIVTPQGTVYAFEFDRTIFDRVIRKIGYGIFFHTYKYQWNRELIILSRHLVYSDLSYDDYGKLLISVEKELPDLPSNGENPQVFKYSILKSGPKDEDSIIKLTFYEGFTVWLTIVIGSTTWKF